MTWKEIENLKVGSVVTNAKTLGIFKVYLINGMHDGDIEFHLHSFRTERECFMFDAWLLDKEWKVISY